MKTLVLTTIALGVLLVAISLPHVYRKVPMNRRYGVRIPAAFESEQRWYDINAHGGRLLARWSILIIACGVVGLLLPPRAYAVYHWITFGVTLFSVLAPTIQVFIWAARQPKV